ncbi:MAG: SMC-Scp complex subunit ScpB [Gammaproteobacteria bacterium]|nr:SMC-Scp complex subunit ScpB [Gammaproteobacteria bacterium]
MTSAQLKNLVEAALLALNSPLTVTELLAMFEDGPDKPDRRAVRKALDELQRDCAGRGVELKEVASGFRYQVRTELADRINRLFQDRPQRYSQALLETLAIIAYRQPVTRGEIEDIRGVSLSAGIVRTLFEREWIKVVGHRDVPGHPELLATTSGFLDYFNLKALEELPSLGEIKDLSQIEPDLFEQTGPVPDAGGAPAAQDAEQTPAAFEDDNVIPLQRS